MRSMRSMRSGFWGSEMQSWEDKLKKADESESFLREVNRFVKLDIWSKHFSFHWILFLKKRRLWELSRENENPRVLKKSFENMGVAQPHFRQSYWSHNSAKMKYVFFGTEIVHRSMSNAIFWAFGWLISHLAKVSMQDMMAMITQGAGFGGKDASICHFVNLCSLSWLRFSMLQMALKALEDMMASCKDTQKIFRIICYQKKGRRCFKAKKEIEKKQKIIERY